MDGAASSSAGPAPRRGDGPQVGRLRARSDFLLAAKGRRYHSDLMTLQARRRPDEAGLRFGLTVTKKVGHATERNRIRRRLRVATAEAGRGRADEPFDVVVIGRRQILAAPYGRLVDDLGRGLASLIRPGPVRSPGSSAGSTLSHV